MPRARAVCPHGDGRADERRRRRHPCSHKNINKSRRHDGDETDRRQHRRRRNLGDTRTKTIGIAGVAAHEQDHHNAAFDCSRGRDQNHRSRTSRRYHLRASLMIRRRSRIRARVRSVRKRKSTRTRKSHGHHRSSRTAARTSILLTSAAATTAAAVHRRSTGRSSISPPPQPQEPGNYYIIMAMPGNTYVIYQHGRPQSMHRRALIYRIGLEHRRQFKTRNQSGRPSQPSWLQCEIRKRQRQQQMKKWQLLLLQLQVKKASGSGSR